MKQVVTDSYEVIEVIGGLDAYIGETYMCSLHGKKLDDFRYNGKIDSKKLEAAIDDELDTLDTLDKINDPYNNI
jgi:hypothetical protein